MTILFMRAVPLFLAITTVLLLIACGREPAPVAAPAPLSRPVVTLQPATRIQVPRSLIVERNGLSGVFVLTADKAARFRLVRLGEARGGTVEIVSGLSGGETLVAGDLGELRDGSIIAANP